MNRRLYISSYARRDMEQALAWTLEKFGSRKHAEYVDLIRLALQTILDDPTDKRSRRRPELHPSARILHLTRRGRRARHFVVYRVRADGDVDIGRVLFDGMDLSRHLPEEFRSDRPESDE